MLDAHRARFPANDIDALRRLVGALQVERRRHDLIAQRQRGEDRLDAAGGAEQVAGGGLGRGHSHLIFRAEQRLDRRQLALVADRRRSGVGIEVLHLRRLDACLAQSQLHRTARAVAILGSGGEVIGVGTGAVADQLDDRRGTASQRVLQRFDHQYAGALAHDEAVAIAVEGPRGALRGVVESAG